VLGARRRHRLVRFLSPVRRAAASAGVWCPAVTIALATAALAVMLAITLGWRHRLHAVAGAAAGAAVLAAGGLIGSDDVATTAAVLWRPAVTITAVMLMTAGARQVGLFSWFAELVEPTTRGPVRRAFARVFALSALVASLLSNDAAILVLTPTVIALLRTVYPRRHGKFTLAFSFAVFYAAGVAPVVTANPMNVVVASHADIGFNAYALRMIPVAVLCWLVSYWLLAREFAAELGDEAPAIGEWPAQRARLGRGGAALLVAMGAVMIAYPVISFFDGPLWAVAAAGASIGCVAALAAAPSGRRGATARALRDDVSWELLPLLAAVLLVASGLARAGVVDALAQLYQRGGLALPTVGAVSALGAAAINNHPMAMLGTLAAERAGGDPYLTLAGLIGGDLGPRLLPMGSLAGLMWMAMLRRHAVELSVWRFIAVGARVTAPCLVATLGALWLMQRAGW
jgi:arsenical pump membrane protein